jgi:deoxyribose-phosphate aldolase
MKSPSSVAKAQIAQLIDHTILKADATAFEVKQVCQEAKDHGFVSVCVNGCWVDLVAQELADSPVLVCTVVGFPLGATTTESKAFEAQRATAASEVDMVINVGRLKAGDIEFVERDIRAVADACHQRQALLKVILETCLLADDEKKMACEASVRAQADFVKTSTGFGKAGATEHDVHLMRSIVGAQLGVKASGGVRTLADLQRMVAAGASRIGASASVSIVESVVAEA